MEKIATNLSLFYGTIKYSYSVLGTQYLILK